MDIIFEERFYTPSDNILYRQSHILLDVDLVNLKCIETVKAESITNFKVKYTLTGEISVTATFKDKFNTESEIEIANLVEDYDSKHFDIIKDYTETISYFINTYRTKTVTEKDIISFCRESLEYGSVCGQGKYKYAETVKDIVEEV